MHKNAIDKEFFNEQTEVKRRKLDVKSNFKTQKNPRLWGRHGGSGGARLTIDSKRIKEADKELNTASDLLAKMNTDIGGDKDWAMIPSEIKTALAKGFNDFLQIAAKSEHLKKLSRKQRRDLRKFFKKSQRWKFKIENLKNNMTEPEEGKKKASKIKPEFTVTFIGEDGSPEETTAIQEMRQTLNEVNMINCDVSTISSPECAALVGEKLTITFDDGSTTNLVQPVIKSVTKGALQTAVMYEMMTPKSYKLKDKQSYVLDDTKEIIIPNEEAGFADRSANVNVTYVDEVVQNIYNQLMNTTFELKDRNDKVIKSMTGRDIVKQNRAGLTSSEIIFEFIDVISSSSNVWSGKVLDFTHKNDGTKVKELDALSTTAKDKANKNLAIQRNNNLGASIVAALEKMPGIKRADDFEYSQEVRITDTGGKSDKDPKKDNTLYPKPGQYAGFKVGFYAYASEAQVKKEETGVKGKLGQSLISLKWIGAPDTGIKFNFNIDFNFNPGVKNKIVHKPLFGNQLKPGGSLWSKLRGYNKKF